jgi:signal transduction histidine kinase
MQNVATASSLAVAILAALQAVIVSTRARRPADRPVPLLFAVAFAALAAQALAVHGSPSHVVAAILIPAMLGAALIQARGKESLLPWAAACGVFLLANVTVLLLGFSTSMPFALFHGSGVCLLAVAAGRMIWCFRWCTGKKAAAWVLVSGGLWTAVDVVAGFIPGTPPVLGVVGNGLAVFLLLGTGWLLFKGRLSPVPRSIARSRRAVPSALTAGAEELAPAALLALGAAHEFRNVLSHVKATAEHGLSLASSPGTAESLRLILDHAEEGGGAAVSVLEQAGLAGRREVTRVDASRDLDRFIRRARAALRGQGVRLESSQERGVVFRARLGEVEQVLFNLVCNAARAAAKLGNAGDEPPAVVHLDIRREEDTCFLEVRDHAGGVPMAMLPGLFTPAAASASGGTGLGLYLARRLAEANNGALEYEPTDDGSIFRLSFPVEETADSLTGGEQGG